jgi:hypothetical protein
VEEGRMVFLVVGAFRLRGGIRKGVTEEDLKGIVYLK